MQPNNSFVSLHSATEQALRLGGIELLRDPWRFNSYALDIANKSLPEVRLIARQADVDLLEPLTHITSTSDAATLRTAASRITQILEDDRFVEKDLAQKTGNELVKGVAAYWGLPFNTPKPPSAHPNATSVSRPAAATPTTARDTVSPFGGSQQASIPTQSNLQHTTTTAPPQVVTAAPPQTPPPVQAMSQPPAKTKPRRRILIVVLLVAVVGAAGAFGIYVATTGRMPFVNSSVRPADHQPSYYDHHEIPTIEQSRDVRTLTQIENELKQDWILFSDEDKDTATSLLYLTNQSSKYKDVELTFRFFDARNNNVGEVEENVVSLGPNETTCVYASQTGASDGTYYYTVYDARTPNAISLGECVYCEVMPYGNSKLNVRLTNKGKTTAHISKAFVVGTNSNDAVQWSSTTWYDDKGQELPGILAPGQSTEISFEGGLWSTMKVDVFPIGYADAS